MHRETTLASLAARVFIFCLILPVHGAEKELSIPEVPASGDFNKAEETAADATPEPPPDPIQTYFGRHESRHPAQRCCFGVDCVKKARGKYAVVTTVRTSEYMPGFRELQCSLHKSNPGMKLIVLAVEGDELTEEEITEIERVATYRLVEDLYVENEFNSRYGKNWVKLRAWEWEDYDALIMLDADMVVLGDLSHLFDLPTDFAWAPMQGDSGWNWNRGGFLMFRPCRRMFRSMMQHMSSDEHLLYKTTFAEQSFLSWFFRYTGVELSMKYNLNFSFLIDGRTPGGEEPLVLHFADWKPFNAHPEDAEWPYLCWQVAAAQ